MRIQCRAWLLLFIIRIFSINGFPVTFLLCACFQWQSFLFASKNWLFFFLCVAHSKSNAIECKMLFISTISRTHIQSTTLSQVVGVELGTGKTIRLLFCEMYPRTYQSNNLRWFIFHRKISYFFRQMSLNSSTYHRKLN